MLVDAGDQVRLTGFGLASHLPRERQAMAPPAVISGTLAYMAPEQTGRMNRSIDTRSDLYALGVTFYEMLTGTLPLPRPTRWNGFIAILRGSRCPPANAWPRARRRDQAAVGAAKCCRKLDGDAQELSNFASDYEFETSRMSSGAPRTS